MQPIFFLPGVTRNQLIPQTSTKVDREVLRKANLDTLFRHEVTCPEEFGCSEVSGNGPDDKSGVLIWWVCAHAPERSFKYKPSQQPYWKKSDLGNYYYYFDPESPATPEDMERNLPDLIEGYPIPLGKAKQRWCIPVIRRPDNSTSLPAYFVYKKGEIETEVKLAYQAAWKRGKKAADLFFTEEGIEKVNNPTEALKKEWFRDAVQTLSLSYHLDLELAGELKILDTNEPLSVLMCACDKPAVDAAIELESDQKKTGQESDDCTKCCEKTGQESLPTRSDRQKAGNSSHGPKADSKDTDQAGVPYF